MCTTDKKIKLSENEHGLVNWCNECNNFTIYYKTIGVTFDEEGMLHFSKLLKDLNASDFVHEVHGIPHVLIKNPKVHIGFCLNLEDVAALQEMINQSRAIVDAFRIIYDLES